MSCGCKKLRGQLAQAVKNGDVMAAVKIAGTGLSRFLRQPTKKGKFVLPRSMRRTENKG